jgi:hypothetical protein
MESNQLVVAFFMDLIITIPASPGSNENFRESFPFHSKKLHNIENNHDACYDEGQQVGFLLL